MHPCRVVNLSGNRKRNLNQVVSEMMYVVWFNSLQFLRNSWVEPEEIEPPHLEEREEKDTKEEPTPKPFKKQTPKSVRSRHKKIDPTPEQIDSKEDRRRDMSPLKVLPSIQEEPSISDLQEPIQTPPEPVYQEADDTLGTPPFSSDV